MTNLVWLLCHFTQINPNIRFMTRCIMQGPMRPRKYVYMWNMLSQRDGAQWLPSAFPLWELHSCKSCKCSEPWLERKTSTKLSLHDTIRKVLKHICLKCLHIVHLDLIYMNYDQKNGWESNWEFDSQPQTLWN